MNYNRVLLSSVLAGEKTADEIVINPLQWYQSNGIDLRVGVRIVIRSIEEPLEFLTVLAMLFAVLARDRLDRVQILA